ncbi:hypothetical protein BDZ89DRAFT_1075195 [Hymenopellis radicata]|nr:hypothetical protein BDZ89DRAFT_1075195 [Hymenopellis radicata]
MPNKRTLAKQRHQAAVEAGLTNKEWQPHKRGPRRGKKLIACGYFNHEGCILSCGYNHAPDAESIPDSRGKNICFHFIMGNCSFLGGTCRYSHSLRHLTATKTQLVQLIVELSKRRQDAGKETIVEEVWEKIIALKAAGDESDEGNVYFCAKRKTKNEYLIAFMDHAGGFSEEDLDILEKKGVNPFKPEARSVLNLIRTGSSSGFM